jgi:hypothetical protein
MITKKRFSLLLVAPKKKSQEIFILKINIYTCLKEKPHREMGLFC